jgi:hypothetical protein
MKLMTCILLFAIGSLLSMQVFCTAGVLVHDESSDEASHRCHDEVYSVDPCRENYMPSEKARLDEDDHAPATACIDIALHSSEMTFQAASDMPPPRPCAGPGPAGNFPLLI